MHQRCNDSDPTAYSYREKRFRALQILGRLVRKQVRFLAEEANRHCISVEAIRVCSTCKQEECISTREKCILVEPAARPSESGWDQLSEPLKPHSVGSR